MKKLSLSSTKDSCRFEQAPNVGTFVELLAGYRPDRTVTSGLDVSSPKSDPEDVQKQFNILRRRFIDQTFRSEKLMPVDKLIGFAISSRVNRETGCTFAHSSTLAQDIGAKFHEGRRALDQLDKAGHLRREDRDQQVYLFPTLLAGAPAPVMPAGTKAF